MHESEARKGIGFVFGSGARGPAEEEPAVPPLVKSGRFVFLVFYKGFICDSSGSQSPISKVQSPARLKK